MGINLPLAQMCLLTGRHRAASRVAFASVCFAIMTAQIVRADDLSVYRPIDNFMIYKPPSIDQFIETNFLDVKIAILASEVRVIKNGTFTGPNYLYYGDDEVKRDYNYSLQKVKISKVLKGRKLAQAETVLLAYTNPCGFCKLVDITTAPRSELTLFLICKEHNDPIDNKLRRILIRQLRRGNSGFSLNSIDFVDTGRCGLQNNNYLETISKVQDYFDHLSTQ